MKRGRKVWLALHRWLGLGLGLWFVLLGLSGSALVFYRGIDEVADARLAHRGSQAPALSLAQIEAALRAEHPLPGLPSAQWRIERPRDAGEVITARLLSAPGPQSTAVGPFAKLLGPSFAPLMVSVDPGTGHVIASRRWGTWTDSPGTWLYDLHYTLLLGEVGGQAVGWVGVALAVSLASGIWLWWPSASGANAVAGAGGRWARAMRFKLGASGPRRVYDIHKLTGLFGGVLLLVLAVTGAALALPQFAKPMIAAFSPLTPMPSVAAAMSVATADGPPGPLARVEAQAVDADAAVALAEALWPGSKARWVDLPASPDKPFRVRVRQPDEPGDRFPDTLVWIDSRTGEVLARRDPADFSVGDRVWRWMHPLHSGEAFGFPGRVFVCCCGVLPLVLSMTGWMRWADKRRARQRAQGRNCA